MKDGAPLNESSSSGTAGLGWCSVMKTSGLYDDADDYNNSNNGAAPVNESSSSGTAGLGWCVVM
jgi:hypothetical protein